MEPPTLLREVLLGKRILVVDDEPDIRHHLQMALQVMPDVR
jgi:hypothetical protein